ncbi:GGDEF domain-containing protein [Pseudonocardia sp. CA-107938]|uniref:GGDEF domain-containing protein n=1 Tax=Pseudonocardia sp. CA-107938 TaxID=3240021 RepID=UPI003D900FB5
MGARTGREVTGADGRRPGMLALPVRALVVVVLVELATAAVLAGDVVAVAAGTIDLTPRGVLVAGLIITGAVLHQEASARLESYRTRVVGGEGAPALNLSSLWIAAGAVLCPPPLATVVAAACYLHLRCFVYSPEANRHPFKIVYTAAATLLAVHAAGAVSGGSVEPATVVLALAAYLAVDTTAVVGMVVLTGSMRVNELARLRPELALEVSLLCLAGLLAAGMSIQPWLIVFIFPPLLILQRTLFVRQLERAARTDGKTGLLTAGAWHDLASAQLEAAGRRGHRAGVLVVDIDHFKRFNDRYGHLAGDEVLDRVAATVQSQLRAHDVVGRFGGEEFVVLLPLADPEPDARAELAAVAERIRAAVSALPVRIGATGERRQVDQVTVSIGGAVFPVDAQHLLGVVAAADAALYDAKRAGRDAVRLAARHHAPAPRSEAPADRHR